MTVVFYTVDINHDQFEWGRIEDGDAITSTEARGVEPFERFVDRVLGREEVSLDPAALVARFDGPHIVAAYRHPETGELIDDPDNPVFDADGIVADDGRDAAGTTDEEVTDDGPRA
ncbi:hypothetical protein BRD17_02965 [Halobacteriales archaeon SW_7_68_16]|nr:MAG: hypothetical protein BRD17_02965 [Halobacteriales archaeon SW_7_68_16]